MFVPEQLSDMWIKIKSARIENFEIRKYTNQVFRLYGKQWNQAITSK